MAALVVSLGLLLPPQALLDSLLYHGQFPEVVWAADSLLEHFPNDTSIQVLAYRYRAFALAALGDTAMALESFIYLLKLRPCWELDPFGTSPPIWRIFRRAKAKVPCMGTHTDPALLDSLQERLDRLERRFTALRRTFFLPGSGQRFLGQRSKGNWLTRLWLLSLGGTAASWWAYDRAREAYQNATTPSEAQSAYQVANRWYRLRLFFGLAVLGLHFYAVLDLL